MMSGTALRPVSHTTAALNCEGNHMKKASNGWR